MSSDDESEFETERLLECAFKKEFFHYVENGVRLPCYGFACQNCVKLNENLHCHCCHETHTFNDKDFLNLKIDKLCRTNIKEKRKKFYKEIISRSSVFKDSESNVDNHFEKIKSEVSTRIEQETENLRKIKAEFYQSIDEKKSHLCEAYNWKVKSFKDFINANPESNLSLEGFYELQNKFIEAQKFMKEFETKLNQTQFKRVEQHLYKSAIGEIVTDQEVTEFIAKRKFEPLDDDDVEMNQEAKQAKVVDRVVDMSNEEEMLSFAEEQQQSSVERFVFKPTFQKVKTTVFHGFKNNKTEFTIFRMYALNENETRFLFIDLHKNMLFDYNFVNNELKAINVDDVFQNIECFIATYYSTKLCKLFISDCNSVFYEFNLNNDTLTLSRVTQLQNCGLLEFMEMAEDDMRFYACDVKSNCLQIFDLPVNTTVMKPKTRQHEQLQKPKYLKIKNNLIFVISNHTDHEEDIQLAKSSSYIFILNKDSLEFQRKISFAKEWLNPYGLYINNEMSLLLTISSKLDHEASIKTISNDRLLVVDLSNDYTASSDECKIIANIDLELNMCNDFHVLRDNKILFFPDRNGKPFSIMEIA